MQDISYLRIIFDPLNSNKIFRPSFGSYPPDIFIKDFDVWSELKNLFQ